METLEESQVMTVRDSAPYRRVVSTTALYTLTFVSFLRLLLFQTRPYSLLNALFALASLLSTSLSILASDEITHPKLNLPQDKHHVCSSPVGSEATLCLWKVSFCYRGYQSIQQYTCEDFAGDGQKCYATIIGTV